MAGRSGCRVRHSRRRRRPTIRPTHRRHRILLDGAFGVATDANLSVQVSDPENANLTTTFYGRELAAGAAPDFTIVALPDTQHYVDNPANVANFEAQTEWIVDEESNRNIVFVTHLGDVVEHADQFEIEWQRASAAMATLDNAGVPNNLTTGNHDVNTSTGNGTFFDQYFPPSRYDQNSWYGGYLGQLVGDPVDRQNKNNYELFSVGGLDFVILHLEYDLPGFALDWAEDILDQYSDRMAIITTHLFVNTSNQRGTSPLARTDGTSAEAAWQRFRTHCNVFMILNGHYPGEGRRTDNNVCGDPVHQVLSDYQERANGGDGWLRIMSFKPSEDRIDVQTFTPVLGGGQFETDANSQFSLTTDLQGGDPFEEIATVSGTPSGGTVSTTWTGLAGSTEYEWYAEVDDGNTTSTGPTWTFTTAADTTAPSPPTGLLAAPGPNNVSLNWTANSEADLAGYNVYRSTTSPVAASGTPLNGVTPVATNSYVDTTAIGGTQYFYVVTAVDGSTNQSLASNEANATPTVPPSMALDFDGVNDYVTFGNGAGLNVTDFTIETWFRRDGAGVSTTTGGGGIASAIPLVAKGAQQAETPLNVNMNWFLGIDTKGTPALTDDTLAADFEDNATGLNHPVLGTAVVTSNVWHHAAATYDTATDTWKLYLDGVLDRTLALGANFTPESTSVQHGSLATSLNATGGTNGFFDGALDEVRLWNVVRSDAQVAGTRDLALAGSPRTGLQARYALDEASGTTTASSIAGAPTGTLTPAANPPAWVTGAPISAVGPNQAPTFTTDITDQTRNEGDTVSLDADATDADFDTLSYSASGLPSGLTINPLTGVISGTLPDGTNGVHNVTVSVSDGTLTDDDTFTLTVNDVDAPPAAPTGLVASAGNGSVALSWNANSEPDLAGYRVFRATSLPVSTAGDGLGGAALITGTSYTDLTAQNGTAYQYVVIAVDAIGGRSAASTNAPATPSANGGTALDFDGTNDLVTFGQALNLGVQSFTIETWFRRDGAGVATSTGTGGVTTIVPLVSKGRGEGDGSNLDMNFILGIDTKNTATLADDTLAADFEDNTTVAPANNNHPVLGATAIPNDAAWHHAAVTYDTASDTWNLYLDGNLNATLALAGNFTPRFDSIQHAGLATAMTSAGTTGAAGFFNGVLDEVRIWNVARSQAQIQASRYPAADQRHQPRRPLRPQRRQRHDGRQQRRHGRHHGHRDQRPDPVGGRLPAARYHVTGRADRSRRGRRHQPGHSQLGRQLEPDLAGYRVFRATSLPVDTTGNGLGGAALITATGYTDLTAANGTTYHYVVVAVDSSANRSAASASASATPSAAAGAAVDLDGTNDFVTFGTATPSLSVTSFTLETWFRRDGAGVGVTTGTGGITSAIPLVTKAAGEGEGPPNTINANYFLGIDASSGVLVADYEEPTGPNHPVSGVTAGDEQRVAPRGGHLRRHQRHLEALSRRRARSDAGARERLPAQRVEPAACRPGLVADDHRHRRWLLQRCARRGAHLERRALGCPDRGQLQQDPHLGHRPARPLRPRRGHGHDDRQLGRRRAQWHTDTRRQSAHLDRRPAAQPGRQPATGLLDRHHRPDQCRGRRGQPRCRRQRRRRPDADLLGHGPARRRDHRCQHGRHLRNAQLVERRHAQRHRDRQ